MWGDGLFDMLAAYTDGKVLKAFLAEAFVDVPDKAISMLVAMFSLDIYDAAAARKKEKKHMALLLALLPALVFSMTLNVAATDFAGDYAGISYDAEDGLISAEINAIAQTADGYIWAGTYSGLYRYDGSHFIRSDIDDRLNSIMQLAADGKGRLWIGTNDSGIACYDSTSGDLTFYDMENGLPANSIRSICADGSGNVYVGTTSELAAIDGKGTITVFDQWDNINGVRSLCYDAADDVIAGVANNGELFFVKDEKLLLEEQLEEDNDAAYGAVASDGKGGYLVGTSADYAFRMHLSGSEVIEDGTVSVGEISYFNRLLYSEKDGGFFFCCENGLGFIDSATDEITVLSTEDFNGSVSDVIMDYQDNVWFVSNKQGVIRFSQNPFEDVFAKAGIPEEIVNAQLIRDQILYVGMDKGLAVVDLATMQRLAPDYVQAFDGVRIRHLMADAAGNIWVSSYGPDGLVKISPDGQMTGYNEADAGTVGSLFRSAIELSDGRILAASTTGLNYITDGELTGTLSAEDGLPTAQILSLVETEDGKIYAGTDGDGVYIIENDKVAGRIGEDAGLQSLVILRIVPCTGGYIYITSNALYFDNGSTVTKLDNFPYSNNYDVYFTQDRQAWISSSAGIYIVSESDLLANEENYNYTLLNHNRGFYTTLTANAKNAVDDAMLYLCCTDGVRRISTSTYNTFDTDYAIRLNSVTAGDEPVKEADGVYQIPAMNGRIQFDVAVLNFTLSNPLIKVYLEGADDDGVARYQNELVPVNYTNLKYGDYVLHVQVIDESDGSAVRDEMFTVHKDAQIFERTYFKVYLLAVCVLFALFVGWLIGNLRHYMQQVSGLQKAATTDPMTGLLNKATSEKELAALCKDEEGVLMMIDLDSFKLVNDLYGHDMGDRVLIRFSELIKSQIGADDLAGRMGGDEFIAFMRKVKDEPAVAERTRFINEEMTKSAKEFMGEDMNIPLGASIGAVRVPDEGTDFAELYRMADKALYTVKQNGKHGYAFYQSTSQPALTEEKDGGHQAASLTGIQVILGERNVGEGAYVVSFNNLQDIYRMFARMRQRYPITVRIAQVTILSADGQKCDLPMDVSEAFLDIMVSTFRQSDILTQMTEGKYFVMLTDFDNDYTGDEPMPRLVERWRQTEYGTEYEIHYEIEQVKGDE